MSFISDTLYSGNIICMTYLTYNTYHFDNIYILLHGIRFVLIRNWFFKLFNLHACTF